MAASCAACLAPIATGERFVLSGTEVFHRRCARGIDRSQRTRLELRVAELERELSMARGTIARDHGAVEAQAMITTRVARERDAAAGDLRVARGARDAALRDSAYWQERHAASERTAIRLRAEIDTLEAVRARTAPAPPQGAEAAPVAKDDRDASEVRFSLLELDKT